jgi:ferric-dicitrate binding protein FerR (iron transport regulator)
MNVTVLGTHFNVNTYQDEGAMKVTLVDGKVKVTTGDGKGAILKPGEQAQVNEMAQIKLVENADVEESVAWKNGLFQFDGDDMGMIMRKVSRWYDVKVSYKNGIPPGHFTGVISRNTDLSEVLKMLERSGVGYNVEGKNLIVL